MPIQNISWLLPVARDLYKEREEIQSFWKQIETWLLGKKKHIAFTGMAGAGKTVLFDYLTLTAYQPSYSPPLTSQALEKGKKLAPKKRMGFSVIPGQVARPRSEAVHKLFEGKNPVDGVVHVVSNGFIELREQAARKVLVDDLNIATIEAYRTHQLNAELEDLNKTCDIIAQSVIRKQKPSWLIVAVTKADLFYNDIEKAEKYYSPHGNSPFVDRLQKLSAEIGSRNFQWTAVPVCSWLEDFRWNEDTQPSTLKPYERNHLLAEFARLLESYCE